MAHTDTHDHPAEPDRDLMAAVLTAVAKIAEINDMVECLVSLVEVAPALPCPTCRGRRSDPIELSPKPRRELEDALLTYLGDAAYLDGLLTNDVVDLFSRQRLEAVLNNSDKAHRRLRAALAPVTNAVADAVSLGMSDRLAGAVAAGWPGQLVTPHRCTCRSSQC